MLVLRAAPVHHFYSSVSRPTTQSGCLDHCQRQSRCARPVCCRPQSDDITAFFTALQRHRDLQLYEQQEAKRLQRQCQQQQQQIVQLQRYLYKLQRQCEQESCLQHLSLHRMVENLVSACKVSLDYDVDTVDQCHINNRVLHYNIHQDNLNYNTHGVNQQQRCKCASPNTVRKCEPVAISTQQTTPQTPDCIRIHPNQSTTPAPLQRTIQALISQCTTDPASMNACSTKAMESPKSKIAETLSESPKVKIVQTLSESPEPKITRPLSESTDVTATLNCQPVVNVNQTLPVSVPASALPVKNKDMAAIKIQRSFRRHQHRKTVAALRRYLSKLNTLETRLSTLAPHDTFPSPKINDNGAIAICPESRPFLSLEEECTRVLEECDSITTTNLDEDKATLIRQRRKEVAKMTQSILDQLDMVKQEAVKAVSRSSSPVLMELPCLCLPPTLASSSALSESNESISTDNVHQNHNDDKTELEVDNMDQKHVNETLEEQLVNDHTEQESADSTNAEHA